MSKGIKLANGLTPEEEQYARLLAEPGQSQAGAYREVWPGLGDMKPSVVYSAASRKAVKVRPRVDELIAALGRETVVNLATLTADVVADRELAHRVENPAAAVQATKLMASMHGHLRTAPPVGDLLAGIVAMLAGLDTASAAKDITISGASREIPPDTPPPPRSGNGPSS